MFYNDKLIDFFLFYLRTMDSILRIFFRQTEELLRLTKTSVHAFQLQHQLDLEVNDLFKDDGHQLCAFTYDLCPELQVIQTHLQSTCFRLQRALYRLQASRQVRAEQSSRLTSQIRIEYDEKVSRALEEIQQIITSTINGTSSDYSPLLSLRELFKQIDENFRILLAYLCSESRQKSAAYLGNVVSNTLERFDFILAALTRLILDVEEMEKKSK